MTMTLGQRRLALTAHLVCSVGWLGAVGCFLVLAIVAVTSRDDQRLRAVVLAMDLTCRWVIVPASLASLVTGVVQALGTRWGLLRHYWVIVKLAINLFATTILLIYSRSLQHLADGAAQGSSTGIDLAASTGPSSIVHAGGAMALLLVAVMLSIYKPRGLTRYGARMQNRSRHSST